MKRFICTLAMALTMGSFAYAQKGKEVKVAIDLKDIKDDKVMVTVIKCIVNQVGYLSQFFSTRYLP